MNEILAAGFSNNMGKGDRKTKRGKIFIGSFGKCRPKKKGKAQSPNKHITDEKEDTKIEPSPVIIPKAQPIIWFEPKAYVHISEKLSSKDEKWVTSKVVDKKWVSGYCFYPLLHRQITQRRFKKCSDGRKAHFDFKTNEPTKKPRHIFYANHLDSAIYSYYAKIELGGKYEQILTETPELSACITAYRRIKVDKKPTKGKSNIHFAKEVFDYIKSQSECIALAFDITRFFDNLNHANLKKAWTSILKTERLDSDHFNIYQSLTNFTYIEEMPLLKLHGLQAISNRKKLNCNLKKLRCYDKGISGKQRASFFRNSIAPKMIVPHSEYEKIVDGEKKGIPQGTPISALLANIYLLEFDKKVLEKSMLIGGFYRRYSDDIIIICPKEHEEEMEKFIMDLISSPEFLLKINPAKTEKSFFAKDATSGILVADKPINYLGFEFDGQRVLLKSAVLSKHHRRKKYFVKRKAKATIEMMEVDANSKLWSDEIWRKYSLSGCRNFLSYSQRAATIMEEKAILRQVRKHKVKLGTYIKDTRDRHGL